MPIGHDTLATPVRKVAVAGAGVIGSGWISRFLAYGLDVAAWDPNPDVFDTSRAAVSRSWPAMRNRGYPHAGDAGTATYHSSLAAACDGADWVQECAPENEQLKRKLLADIDAVTPAAAVIASSSSGLLPSSIQSDCHAPHRVIVAHPFNPVYLLPLVELVAGSATAEATLTRGKTFYASVGMTPLHVRVEIEGYLSDRLQEAMWREILHLVNDDVATTAELDDAIRYGPGLRWPVMGTCLTFHLAGGDAGMAHMLDQFGPALELPWTHMSAPPLTGKLREAMVAGTAEQSAGMSVGELEEARDEALVAIMNALERLDDRLRNRPRS